MFRVGGSVHSRSSTPHPPNGLSCNHSLTTLKTSARSFGGILRAPEALPVVLCPGDVWLDGRTFTTPLARPLRPLPGCRGRLDALFADVGDQRLGELHGAISLLVDL